MKWINEIYGDEYDTEAEAYEAISEMIDIDDIADEVDYGEITLTHIIKELLKYDSPLCYKLLENARQRKFDNCISTIDEDDEEYD